MNNKKLLMFISAVMIIIFHLWYTITASEIEIVLRKICVIGVDIFFFISAFNIGIKKISYKEFLKNRIVNIYFKFVIFSIIYILMNNKNIVNLLKIIFGIDLFIKGGGSFLWFVPAIIIMYLLLPLYKCIDEKYCYSKYVLIAIYLVSVILISMYSNYNSLFILLNRVPIILVGYYCGKTNILSNINKKLYWLLTIVFLLGGFSLSYYITKNPVRLNWFYDVFYILNVPLIMGIILLVNRIKENKITNFLGCFTLELYAIQMLFGFRLALKVSKFCSNPLIINIVLITIIFFISIIIYYLFNYLLKLIKTRIKS